MYVYTQRKMKKKIKCKYLFESYHIMSLNLPHSLNHFTTILKFRMGNKLLQFKNKYLVCHTQQSTTTQRK